MRAFGPIIFAGVCLFAACEPRSPASSKETEKSGLIQRQAFRQRRPHSLHFILSDDTKSSFQLHNRNGLNLLQVKCAGFQKWFGDREFPLVAAQRRRVEKDRDKIEFAISGDSP